MQQSTEQTMTLMTQMTHFKGATHQTSTPDIPSTFNETSHDYTKAKDDLNYIQDRKNINVNNYNNSSNPHYTTDILSIK